MEYKYQVCISDKNFTVDDMVFFNDYTEALDYAYLSDSEDKLISLYQGTFIIDRNNVKFHTESLLFSIEDKILSYDID